jgi:midasin (ATPase involved in ribosome maturation)
MEISWDDAALKVDSVKLEDGSGISAGIGAKDWPEFSDEDDQVAPDEYSDDNEEGSKE